MSKLEMNSEHEIPLRHEFICTGFIERVASWARFLCLGFLFLQLLATAVNLIYPFAVDPPQFYNQLLFFLLACAAFEVFAIPIEAIRDHCIIDLQKAMVIKVYNRYFFNRVEVLTNFEKIRALGVSARPAPFIKGVFSESTQRYAILMLTDNRRLHRLTDYNLGLAEADQLVKSLHDSYLRHVNIMPGAENIELCLDQSMSNSFVLRPCRRSAMTLIDATLIPSFQAGLGMLLVALLVSVTAMVGDYVSDKLFSTSLKIANQPIFQLVFAPAVPDPETLGLTPPEGPPPASPFTQAQIPADSATETASIANVSATVTNTSEPSLTVLDDIPFAAIPADNQSSPDTVDTSAVTDPVDSNSQSDIADNRVIASAAPELATPSESVSSETPPADFVKIDDKSHNTSQPENIDLQIISSQVADDSVTPAPVQKPVDKAFTNLSLETPSIIESESSDVQNAVNLVLVPLPSRIPTFDESIISVTAAAEDSAQPLKIVVPVQAMTSETVSKTPEEPRPARPLPETHIEKAILKPQPVSTQSNPASDVTDSTRPEIRLKQAPVASVQNTSVAAASYIGQSVNSALNSLGKPLTEVKSTNGQQLIYSGITLLTDSQNKTIIQVNLTSRQSKTLGKLATSEGLTVGSLVREAKARLGIPQQRKNSPGLHFPARGISIYPLPGDSDIIGSIQLYQARELSEQ